MSYSQIQQVETQPGAVLDQSLLEKIRNNFDNLKLHNDQDADIIKDTMANLSAIALTSANSKVCYATDLKKMFYVEDGAFLEVTGEKKDIHSTTKRTTADHSRKDAVLRDFVVLSGTPALTYNEDGNSATGKGRFEITGIGSFTTKKFLPVNPLLGIAEVICINTNAVANVSVGVEYFDANLASLGIRNLAINAAALNTTALELNFYRAMTEGIGAANNQVPQSARFVKPILNISSNNGIVAFDNFDLQILSFARASLWS